MPSLLGESEQSEFFRAGARAVLGLLCLAFAVALALPSGARAARLVTSGFETNNFTETEWTVTGGTTPTFATTVHHSGTYSLHSNPSANTSSVGRYYSASLTSGSLYDRVYVCVDAFPNAAAALIRHTNNAAEVSGGQINFVVSGSTWQIKNAVSGTTQTGTTALTTGNCMTTPTWYRFELRTLIADSGGEVEGRLYSGESETPLETLSITNEDTLGTNVIRSYFGLAQTNSSADIYTDDACTNHSGGTFQTSWCGPGKVVLLEPTFDRSVAWTPNPSGSNAANVDDEPGTPDDDTTYNSVSDTSSEDKFYLPDLPTVMPPSATLTLAHVFARAGGDGATARTIRLRWWDENDAAITGPAFDVNVSGYRIGDTDELLVVDLSTSTREHLVASKIGYVADSGTGLLKKVTALWANVEYVGDVPSGVEVSSRSDILSDSRPSATSNHTISFRVNSAISASSTLEVRFPADFSFPSGLDCGDVDVATGTEWTLSTTSTGCEVTATTWGAVLAPSPPTLVITAPTSTGVYVATGTVITIKIGTNATFQQTGTTRITNPSSSGTYTISAGGTFGGSGDMLVAIVSGVTVEARVAESLSITVSAVAAGSCTADDGASGTSRDTTSVSVPFGSVSPNAFYIGCQDLVVSTNAGGGYSLTTQESRPMMTAGGAAIPDTTCDTGSCTESAAAAWTNASNNGFGHTCFNQVNHDCASAYSNGTNFRQFADISAGESAQELMASSTPASATGRAKFRLSRSSGQAAGTYTTVITYIITPTF